MNDCLELYEDYEVLSDSPTTTPKKTAFAATNSTNQQKQQTPAAPTTTPTRTTTSGSSSGTTAFITPGAPVFKKRRMNNDDKVQSAFINSFQTICGKFAESDETDDEDTYFAKSIGQQMKKMNDEEKFQFKSNVLQLAHEAVNNSK